MEVSCISAGVDEQVEAFRSGPLDGRWRADLEALIDRLPAHGHDPSMIGDTRLPVRSILGARPEAMPP